MTLLVRKSFSGNHSKKEGLCLRPLMAGPEGFEPSTIPRASPVELALQVKSFSL